MKIYYVSIMVTHNKSLQEIEGTGLSVPQKSKPNPSTLQKIIYNFLLIVCRVNTIVKYRNIGGNAIQNATIFS